MPPIAASGASVWRTGMFVVSLMLAGTMVLMPPQIRPAAYNQVPPSLQSIVLEQQRVQQARGGGGQGSSAGGSLLEEEEDSSAAAVGGDGSKPLDPAGLEGANISSLMLFVVFHRQLHDDLYRDLSVPHAEMDITKSSGENASTLLLNRGVTFVAANPAIEKHFNPSNPLFRNRIVHEWETPGYSRCAGAHFNEYGAMNSIYCSDWTLAGPHACHPGEGPSQRNEAAAAVLDTSFVGVLQYDMRLDTNTIKLLRRRIRRFRAKRVDAEWLGRAHRLRRQLPSAAEAAGGSEALQAEEVHARESGSDGVVGSAHLDQVADAGSRLSPKHRMLVRQKQLAAVEEDRHRRQRCCVFYAVTHPTRFLLSNPVGRRLVGAYNAYYGTRKTLSDAGPVGVLDGFVVPYSDFNSMMEFVRHVMALLVDEDYAAASTTGGGDTPVPAVTATGANRIVSRADLEKLPDGKCTVHPLPEDQSVSALDVMERAVALWLAFVDDIEFVAMPIKHQKL